MIMNPPGHCSPGTTFLDVIHKPRNYNAGHSSIPTTLIWIIPNVTAKVLLVASTVQFVFIAELINLGRAIAGPHMDPAECCLQGLKQLLTKHASSFYGPLRIIGDVSKSMPSGNLALQKLPHEEISRQPNPPEVLEPVIAGD